MSRRCVTREIVTFASSLLLLAAPGVPGQRAAIRDAVESMDDGRIVLSYDARPGVRGDGRNISFGWRNYGHWHGRLQEGPVRVTLRVIDGGITDINTVVGGRPVVRSINARDLGTVPAAEAARFLLQVARADRSPAAEDAILPAMLADGVVVWPELVGIARDESISGGVREAAVFWLGQEAAATITAELAGLVEDPDGDLEVREAAIFALSQRPPDEGIPALLRVARSRIHPSLREKALFWLAQEDDPRVVSLFEEILSDGSPTR